MLYPNLNWALSYMRVAQYRLATVLVISESCLSRRLAGRAEDFAPHEKQRIAEYLGFRADWLFAEVTPPASARLSSHTAAGQGGGACAQA